MRLIKLFLFLLPSVLVSQGTPKVVSQNTLLVCYGRLDPSSIKGYRYVILEAAHYKKDEINQIRKQNDHVLAYISLGEVNVHAQHFKRFEKNTLGKNNIWNSRYLDLRQPSTAVLLKELMQEGFDNGFDGYFLDNIDNYGQWGKQKDQHAELVSLLSDIRKEWPEKQFIQNAGLEFLPETAELVNAVIVESVATEYNFELKNYRLRGQADFDNYADKLRTIKERHQLPVVVIDYAGTQNLKQQAEARLQSVGFEYFIANIDLQTLPKFNP